MLMRFDPIREMDRLAQLLTQQTGPAHQAAMPMDARLLYNLAVAKAHNEAWRDEVLAHLRQARDAAAATQEEPDLCARIDAAIKAFEDARASGSNGRSSGASRRSGGR